MFTRSKSKHQMLNMEVETPTTKATVNKRAKPSVPVGESHNRDSEVDASKVGADKESTPIRCVKQLQMFNMEVGTPTTKASVKKAVKPSVLAGKSRNQDAAKVVAEKHSTRIRCVESFKKRGGKIMLREATETQATVALSTPVLKLQNANIVKEKCEEHCAAPKVNNDSPCIRAQQKYKQRGNKVDLRMVADKNGNFAMSNVSKPAHVVKEECIDESIAPKVADSVDSPPTRGLRSFKKNEMQAKPRMVAKNNFMSDAVSKRAHVVKEECIDESIAPKVADSVDSPPTRGLRSFKKSEMQAKPRMVAENNFKSDAVSKPAHVVKEECIDESIAPKVADSVDFPPTRRLRSSKRSENQAKPRMVAKNNFMSDAVSKRAHVVKEECIDESIAPKVAVSFDSTSICLPNKSKKKGAHSRKGKVAKNNSNFPEREQAKVVKDECIDESATPKSVGNHNSTFTHRLRNSKNKNVRDVAQKNSNFLFSSPSSDVQKVNMGNVFLNVDSYQKQPEMPPKDFDLLFSSPPWTWGSMCSKSEPFNREKHPYFDDDRLLRQKYWNVDILPLSAEYISNRISLMIQHRRNNENWLKSLAGSAVERHSDPLEEKFITGQQLLEKLSDNTKELASSEELLKPIKVHIIYGHVIYRFLLAGVVPYTKKFCAAIFSLFSIVDGDFLEATSIYVVDEAVPRCFYPFAVDADKLLASYEYCRRLQEIYFCYEDVSVVAHIEDEITVWEIICYCRYMYLITADVPPQAALMYSYIDMQPLSVDDTYYYLVAQSGHTKWYLFVSYDNYDVDITVQDLKDDEYLRQGLAWLNGYDEFASDDFKHDDTQLNISFISRDVSLLESSIGKLSVNSQPEETD